jgi:hypothetical protein
MTMRRCSLATAELHKIAAMIDPLSAKRQPIEPISWVAQLLRFALKCHFTALVLKELPGFTGFGDQQIFLMRF